MEKTGSNPDFGKIFAEHQERIEDYVQRDFQRRLPDNKRADAVRRFAESLMLANHGVMLSRAEVSDHLANGRFNDHHTLMRWKGYKDLQHYSLEILIPLKDEMMKYEFILYANSEKGEPVANSEKGEMYVPKKFWEK